MNTETFGRIRNAHEICNLKVNFRGVNLWWNRTRASIDGMLSFPSDCDDNGNPVWDKAGADLSPGASFYASAYGHTYPDGKLRAGAIVAPVQELQQGWQETS